MEERVLDVELAETLIGLSVVSLDSVVFDPPLSILPAVGEGSGVGDGDENEASVAVFNDGTEAWAVGARDEGLLARLWIGYLAAAARWRKRSRDTIAKIKGRSERIVTVKADGRLKKEESRSIKGLKRVCSRRRLGCLRPRTRLETLVKKKQLLARLS